MGELKIITYDISFSSSSFDIATSEQTLENRSFQDLVAECRELVYTKLSPLLYPALSSCRIRHLRPLSEGLPKII